MPDAEFEEKEYEGPLYNQLERKSNLLWSPGQVLENLVGIDRGIFLEEALLWPFFNNQVALKGLQLSRYKTNPFFRSIKKNHQMELPNFKLNLFIQAKRPSYSTKPTKKLRNLGLTKKYWSIYIKDEQQEILSEFSKMIGSKGHVCYATPVFDTKKELFNHTKKETIIENSNFPPVESLVNHTRWHYNLPGSSGVANEDFINYQFKDLKSILENISREFVNYSSTYEDLIQLIEIITNLIRNPNLSNSEANFNTINSFDEIERLGQNLQFNEAYIKYLQIVSFVSEFNLQWYIIGQGKNKGV
ncbi:hypothetical protein EHQ92_18085 [Leptospira biflexa]|uniref:hypothetical protein n=1 Tax=Leptospira biflexa TaxID=172 RepID=UPI0010918001|nr:hypothetical protein [Leptospira biflexa]TGM41708.1 hypothetical protein EHQ92_18085 [Leptospira biflexa]